MRLIDADELIEHAWRDKLDSRELIAEMIEKAPTIKEIPTKIPIGVFEKLISQELIPDKIKNENVKLCKELKKARKEKKRWKKKYIELRDGKKSIELARIEDGLGLKPILYR